MRASAVGVRVGVPVSRATSLGRILEDVVAREAEIAKVQADMDTMVRRVENPLFVTVATFGEPFPVGLVIALVSAGVLRRRRAERGTVLATAPY